jgi:hypothetical protein
MEAPGKAWPDIASFRTEKAEEKVASWRSKAETGVESVLFRGLAAREEL